MESPTDGAGAVARAPADPGRLERTERLAGYLERAQAGEIGALDDVVRELNPLLWHVARSQGLSQSEVADVVQTTWLELVRRLAEIRTPQALTGWLVTATKREAWRTNRRGQRAVDKDDLSDVPDGGPEPDDRLIVDERDRTLWGHFQRLSKRCRELLRIVAMVDRPDYTLVSEALEMPHGSIGPTRGRCLTKLREMLLADPAWGVR